MKAKLSKVENGWVLMVDNTIYATDENSKELVYRKLATKNCQAIERGYDLDELVENEENKHYALGLKHGFQKALEILGDKKFSEEDVILIAEYIRVASQSTPSVRTKDLFDEYQSLQKNEWDVEIEMEIVPDFYSRSDEDGSIFTSNKKEIPKLDADGCLILKLKSE